MGSPPPPSPPAPFTTRAPSLRSRKKEKRRATSPNQIHGLIYYYYYYYYIIIITSIIIIITDVLLNSFGIFMMASRRFDFDSVAAGFDWLGGRGINWLQFQRKEKKRRNELRRVQMFHNVDLIFFFYYYYYYYFYYYYYYYQRRRRKWLSKMFQFEFLFSNDSAQSVSIFNFVSWLHSRCFRPDFIRFHSISFDFIQFHSVSFGW